VPRATRSRRQKVAPSLRGFADAKKPKIDLLRDVRTHVVAENTKNGDAHRSKDKIHVSEIVKGACPRMLFYKVTGTEPTDSVPGVFSQLISIWSAGSAEHEKWQRWLREMDDLWGTWTCLLCEHSWEGPVPGGCPACEQCRTDLIRYDEVNLHVDSVNLVGHADAAVPRLESLVEIKSFSAGSVRVENPSMVAEHTHKVEGRSVIDQEALWKAVKRPLLSHLIQGLFYLWMSREMGLPYKKIIFIYENKTTQATKSFEVTLSERRLEPYLGILTEVKEAAETGVVPPRPKLYAPDAKPCSTCPFRSLCWSVPDNSNEVSDGVSEEDSMQARAQVDSGEHRVRRQGRTRVSRVQSHSNAEAASTDTDVPERTSRPQRRGERTSRRTGPSSGVSSVLPRGRTREEPEESGRRSEKQVSDRVRDHRRGVRRDGRGSRREVQDLPEPSGRPMFERRSRSRDR
jgi:CRISPR/Cas system-associated exonuclease Cas4 (RecB family)